MSFWRAAQFRQIVRRRGDELRRMSLDQLSTLWEPADCVEVGRRLGSVATIVKRTDDGRLRVVIQGFLAVRWLPWAKQVALDGFYRDADGTVTAMDADEFPAYD